MFKILFILILNMYMSFLNAYAVTCNEALNSNHNSTETIEINTKERFEYSSAIVEEAMASHGLSFKTAQLGEMFYTKNSNVLQIGTYVVTFKNGDQFVLQFKYIEKAPNNNRFFVINIVDIDRVLWIFDNEEPRYDFLTSFLPRSMHPNKNDPDFTSHDYTGFNLNDFSVQLLDKYNPNYNNAMPYSVEAIRKDFTDIDLDPARFQGFARRIMSNFSRFVPEQ